MLCASAVSTAQQFPHVHAHSHNDYEQNRPLKEALQYGFISVEADVYLFDGELYVAHDRPERKDPARTLRALYLDPLLQRTKAHDGRVYGGYEGFFYLMIDIKSDGAATCNVLDRQLRDYASMISETHDSLDETDKPVKVLVSGNRTGNRTELFRNEDYHFFALDGRPEDLGRNFPSTLMPVVSQDYWKMVSWNGEGEIDPTVERKLEAFVAAAHAEGKTTRLWGEPDNPKVWAYLLDKGIDLINTDRIPELSVFLDERHQMR
jgi:hypothetical protein